MAPPARTAARLACYRLMEAAQGEGHAQVASHFDQMRLTAVAEGWPEVAFLAQLGIAMLGVLRPDVEHPVIDLLNALVEEGEELGDRALLAHALGLRAITAASSGDAGALLSDAARGLALIEGPTASALDVCTALVVCAAAFNSLSLWELVDEIYDRAAALEPACEAPLQAPAIAVNRVLIRLEWASALLETGQEEDAREQLRRAQQATRTALARTDVPTLWRAGVEAVASALQLFLGPALRTDQLLATAATQQAALRAAGELEALPLAGPLVALALLRRGQPQRAADWLATGSQPSTSSGARSFPFWVRAQVAAAVCDEQSPALDAGHAYAALLVQQRRDNRRALVAAARSRIMGERLRTERDRLARDVSLDPLTGLGNRRAFDDWLGHRVLLTTPTALLVIDLDNFKLVNDRFGHAIGDDVLRRVGALINGYVRSGDLAVRLGGDEFAIILERRVTEARDADGGALARIAGRRADDLRRAIAAEPWSRLTPGLRLEASVGAAVGILRPDDHGAAAALYRRADSDLYDRKGDDPTRVRGTLFGSA